jgi:superfamily II DNA/RNA helicase
MQNKIEISRLGKILQELGISEYTEPQRILFEVIDKNPSFNIFLHAKNGTGKTIGYFLSCLHQLLNNTNSRILIITPTRELALQVYSLFNIASNNFLETSIITKLLVGGLSVADDKENLRSITPNVIVGTAGRILQMMKLEIISFPDFSFIIFDEYDKLFENKEFQHMLKIIRKDNSKISKSCKFICVSATFVPSRFKVLKNSIRRVKSVNVGRSLEGQQQKADINLAGIKQYIINLDSDISSREKITTMIKGFCESIKFRKGIIFYNEKVNGDDMCQDFRDTFPGMEIVYIHGDLPQRQRFKLFNKFRHQDVKLAITTDLFSRGVDFDNVDVVFNFDMPFNAETYFHRIGRCGRNGNNGVSFIFLTNKLREFIEQSWLYELNLIKFRFENELETIEAIQTHLSKKDPIFLKTNPVEQNAIHNQWVEAGEVIYDQSKFKFAEESMEEEVEGGLTDVNQKHSLDISDEIFHCKHCKELLIKMSSKSKSQLSIAKYFNLE